MKKTIVVIAAAALLAAGAPSLSACTNILVTKKASADGSTHITYSADSHTLYGELNFIPAGEHIEGSLIDVFDGDTGKYLGKIRQVKRTFQVVGLINEWQVAIGETTFGGREELMDPKAVVDYGSLMNLALQRAKTAREAIRVMTDLVAEYGYASSGESFSIADANEVWILEMISKGPDQKGAVWVARLVPDGMICAHANQSRIRAFPMQKGNDWSNPRQTVYHAPDVVSFARAKGYFQGRDDGFSFAEAYNPPDFGGLRACEARVWNVFRRATLDGAGKSPMDGHQDYAMGHNPANPMPLFVAPARRLSVRDVMELMRDHFEGTEMDLSQGVGAGPFRLPYRWRPMQWKADEQAGESYVHERSISTQQTGFSFVTQSRAWLPAPVGGIIWFGFDDTFSTVYVPMYCGIRRVPASFGRGAGTWNQFSWDSAFWVFNFVANWAYSRYSDMIGDVQAVQRELEGKFLALQPELEAAALELHRRSPEQARDYLTAYCVREGDEATARWRKLGEFLVWKYLDGNVRDSQGRVTHPEYPKGWYKRIVAESGPTLRVPPQKKE